MKKKKLQTQICVEVEISGEMSKKKIFDEIQFLDFTSHST
jgi:hypothetical protein